MMEKELLNILLDISRQKNTFTYLEDNNFNDKSKENLTNVLISLLKDNKINEIKSTYVNNTNYLILRPNRYCLTLEGMKFLK